MDQIRCVIERITYQNQETGYTVLRCRVKGYQELITLVGNLPRVYVGTVLRAEGSWTIDSRYGRQFAMESFEEQLPATVFGMEKYLGSGMIRGIGPKFAKKIVAKFGKDTLEIIEKDPDRLLSVPGIGKMLVERIKTSWVEQKEIKNIMIFLQSHDVSTLHATRIYKEYGDESIRVVRENPYRLADEVRGIGFKTADIIASKMGFDHLKYVRLRSGLLYTMNRLADEGHCYATRELLLETGCKLLEVEESLLSMTLDEMIRVRDLFTEIREEEKIIYLPPFFFAESGTAKHLSAIFKAPKRSALEEGKAEESILKRIKNKSKIEYDEVQIEAIKTALKSKIMILTGGPGTGKTTTTLGIIEAYKESGARILLAAPTGRAAKRLSEATGLEAKTIHRLLEIKPPDAYQKNEEEPLEGDVLILDECSMIDLLLMYHLLKAVPNSMSLILVGDIDQLPSVGAGNVLRDMIDSERFPLIRLCRIFRQAQSSRIILNAHRINTGKMPDISNGRESDFFFMEEENPERALKTIVSLVSDKLPRYYGVKPGDIQVLTPMQKGEIGAENLNQALQRALNPSKEGIRRGGYFYCRGDKVMQIRNNYDNEVFNGDIGRIESVDAEEGVLSINFEGRSLLYESARLDEIVLAYASTIHKSQGSEYKIVVMPVLMNHYMMLQRNLIYTGITRAKKILVIVGSKKALAYAVENVKVSDRKTLLKERLEEELPLF
ncbi:MAG: ATP-dependent RecD-like DNA helicase [Johnsonella sp.]|nr:ATP-dependent RecD-like DNA helicase [Johnsonella sp.]